MAVKIQELVTAVWTTVISYSGYMRGTRMRWGHVIAAAAVGLLFALTSIAQDAKPAAAEPQWLTSFDAALAEARKSGKPILANFTEGASDPWGGPWSYRMHH